MIKIRKFTLTQSISLIQILLTVHYVRNGILTGYTQAALCQYHKFCSLPYVTHILK